MVKNEYIYSSNVKFEYREDGRYDDLIMRLLNEIMTRCDENSSSNDGQGLSNYKEFENLMAKTFEKSFDEEWMNSAANNNEKSNA